MSNMEASNMQEEWRQIEGFPRYRVSNLGGAQRLNHRGEWVACAQCLNSSGYPTVVAVGEGGRKRQAATHIYVAETFIGPRPSPDHEVMHLDGSRTNNRVDNLRYGTRAENSRDAVKHGTHTKYLVKGENNGRAKLSREQVLQIVGLVRAGAHKQEVAARFDVSAMAVHYIMIGKRWAHETGIEFSRAR